MGSFSSACGICCDGVIVFATHTSLLSSYAGHICAVRGAAARRPIADPGTARGTRSSQSNHLYLGRVAGFGVLLHYQHAIWIRCTSRSPHRRTATGASIGPAGTTASASLSPRPVRDQSIARGSPAYPSANTASAHVPVRPGLAGRAVAWRSRTSSNTSSVCKASAPSCSKARLRLNPGQYLGRKCWGA